MGAERVRFKQADVTRVARGLAAAGLQTERVEIDPTGKIVAFVRSGGQAPKPGNPWDAELE